MLRISLCAILLLLFAANLTAGNTDKLAEKVGKEACKCATDPSMAGYKEVDPEGHMKNCLIIAFRKYEKQVKAVEAGDKIAYNKFTVAVALYLKQCGAFNHVMDNSKPRPGGVDFANIKPHGNAEDCAGFREGVFTVLGEDTAIGSGVFMERKDSIQFEYWGSEGEHSETRVIWDEGCRYHTSHIGSNSDEMKKNFTPGQGIKVVIMNVDGDIYSLGVQRPDGKIVVVRYRKLHAQPFKYIKQ